MNSYIKNRQIIFLNQDGCITLSNDQLFTIEDLKDDPILEKFPFIQSIFPSLLLLPHGKVFTFRKIKTIHSYLPGIYDYTFIKICSCVTGQEIIIWTILDQTKEYERLLIQQQYKQEIIIKKEHLPIG